MPQLTKKILRGRKGEIGTSTDATEGSDIKVSKLLDFIELSNSDIEIEMESQLWVPVKLFRWKN